jgi:hypothetical protein
LSGSAVFDEVAQSTAMEARSYRFGGLCRHTFGEGLVGSWEPSVVRGSGPRQVHRDLDVVVCGAWSVRGVILRGSLALRLALLIILAIPAALLEVASELLEVVLGSVVRDSSACAYCFDHLSGLGVLDGFGLVLLVVLREWGCYDCV